MYFFNQLILERRKRIYKINSLALFSLKGKNMLEAVFIIVLQLTGVIKMLNSVPLYIVTDSLLEFGNIGKIIQFQHIKMISYLKKKKFICWQLSNSLTI